MTNKTIEGFKCIYLCIQFKDKIPNRKLLPSDFSAFEKKDSLFINRGKSKSSLYTIFMFFLLLLNSLFKLFMKSIVYSV